MTPHVSIALADGSHLAEALRRAMRLVAELGFGESDARRVASVVTEAGTNILKHAGSGTMLLGAAQRGGDLAGVDIFALDRGPGIAEVRRYLELEPADPDGPGRGLRTMARAASRFDVYAPAGNGTAWFMRVLPNGSPASAVGWFEIAGVSIAAPGESVSGDSWAAVQAEDRALVFVADGLGHGPLAASAADHAARVACTHWQLPAGDLLDRVHRSLLSTRGAAASIAEISVSRNELRYTGAGNIAAVLATGIESHDLVTQSGTLGAHFARPHVHAYPWSQRSALILHSDGVTTRWNLARYPALLQRHPGLVAAVLLRDHLRGRDDATVVVVKAAGETP